MHTAASVANWGDVCLPRGVSTQEGVYLGGVCPGGVFLGVSPQGGCLPKEVSAQGRLSAW